MADPSTTSLRHVSTPMTIRGKQLRARVYLPAHQPGLAEGGMPGERYVDYHRQRARAGLGMQITGATPVQWSEVWADGLTLVNVDDRIVPGYRALAQAVHAEGGLMLAQLAHVGAMETSGNEIISASWERSELTQQISREATREELANIVELFRRAAARCRAGDLDGIEITMAHGMLLASFLSPLMNRRTDEFGGDLDGRTRFPLQVVAAVRDAMGEDAIVGIRMPGDELLENGIDAAEAAALARRLTASGMVDYFSITAGNNTRKLSRVDHWPPTPAPFGAFRHLSRAVRDAIDTPVATVGRVTTLEQAEEILAAGDADLVGMVRANIADPRMLPKARASQPKTIRPCVGANVCINSLLDHETLRCMVNPELGRPLSSVDAPIAAARSAVVVGGGPAGLEAARRLALRGFRTTLLEARDRLGGQMDRWSRTPSREEFLKAIRWWEDELERLDVRVDMGRSAEAGDIVASRPSVVLLATGSIPLADVATPLGGTPSFGPYDAPAGGGHVLVRDEIGRLAAMLTAERLSLTWKKVTLVTSALHPGEGEGITTTYTLLRELGRRGIEIHDRARLVRVENGTATLRGTFEEVRPTITGVDAVVSVLGATSHVPLLAELAGSGLDVRVIGDAKLPRDVTAAVRGAAEMVWSLASRNEPGAGIPHAARGTAKHG